MSAKVNARVCRTLFPQVRTIGLSMAALLASTALAGAQTLDLGTVGVSGAGSSASDTAVGTKAAPGTAAAVAPTQGSLYSIEPESIISDKFIRDTLPPQSDFSQIVKLVPSVYTSSPNGPGASEAKIYMRGFTDGQYNVLVDGVPFGDANDPTHHSTAYLPGGALSGAVVDRGPGLADAPGYSSFGGSINLLSRELTDAAGGHFATSFGSYNTWNNNIEAQSGVIKETGTRVLFNYDNTSSNGALQNGDTNRKNYMLKISQPIGESWNATFMSSVETDHYNNIAQITLAQAAKYGQNYGGLNQNPKSEDYVGYNHTNKTTDFEILTLNGDAGFFQVDNKTYTYAYINKDVEEKDQTLDTVLPTSFFTRPYYTAAQIAAHSTDVMGFQKENKFRAYGDIMTMSHDVDYGLLSGTGRTGIWVEHVNNNRYYIQRDFTDGGMSVDNSVYPTGFQYDILSKIDTFQPYVEYEWKPTQNWSITPGYKYYNFTRSQFGDPNQTAGGKTQTVTAQASSASYQANLGFLTARYRATSDLSFYGQYAMGIQAPTVSALYVADPAGNNMQPQTTTNYQTGVVWKNDRVTADFDAYFIDFNNYAQVEGTGNSAYYTNIGGVYYKGLEGEATVSLGYGLALYGGGSLNDARSKGSDLWVANAPTMTGTAGFIYDDQHIFGSLLGKYTGPRYSGSQVVGTDFNRLKAYNSTDLVVGYRFLELVPHTTETKITFGVTDLMDHRSVTDSSAMLSGSTPTPTLATYYWQAGRSYFAALSVGF